MRQLRNARGTLAPQGSLKRCTTNLRILRSRGGAAFRALAMGAGARAHALAAAGAPAARASRPGLQHGALHRRLVLPLSKYLSISKLIALIYTLSMSCKLIDIKAIDERISIKLRLAAEEPLTWLSVFVSEIPIAIPTASVRMIHSCDIVFRLIPGDWLYYQMIIDHSRSIIDFRAQGSTLCRSQCQVRNSSMSKPCRRRRHRGN